MSRTYHDRQERSTRAAVKRARSEQERATEQEQTRAEQQTAEYHAQLERAEDRGLFTGHFVSGDEMRAEQDARDWIKRQDVARARAEKFGALWEMLR